MQTQMKIKSLFPIFWDAKEKFNFAQAHKVAELMGIRYHWSAGNVVTQSEIEIMLETVINSAEGSFQKNVAAGAGKTPVSVRCGGFALTAIWWGEQDTPQVYIHFGICAVIEGSAL
jgi:hypothetical protein